MSIAENGYTADERAFLAEAVAEISSTNPEAKTALAREFFRLFGKRKNPGTLYSAGLRFRKQMFFRRRTELRNAMRNGQQRMGTPPLPIRTMPQIRTRAASGHAAFI